VCKLRETVGKVRFGAILSWYLDVRSWPLSEVRPTRGAETLIRAANFASRPGRPDLSKAAVRNIDRLATRNGFTVILDKHKSGTNDLVGPAQPIVP
jgi:hypothetical protein